MTTEPTNRAAAVSGMRVAYLASQYPAPSHTFIKREISALRIAGLTVETFSIRPPSPGDDEDASFRAEAAATFVVLGQNWLTFAGAHVAFLISTPVRYIATFGASLRHRPPGMRGLFLSFVHFAEAGVLARELRRRRTTHLHNHFANSAATVGFLVSRLLALPWSFTMHGISETDYPAGVTLEHKIRAARFVACASWFGRAQAMRLVEPTHWPKISVVRCGLNMANQSSRPRARSSANLICVGRLSPEKGHAGLLAAFAAVRGNFPEARLVLVGDGPDRERLEHITRDLGLEPYVRFDGSRAETETLEQIAAADILVMASFMEGLPVVLMEAMAAGTAVIAPRVAGIPEIVLDQQNGLLFTPSDWDELADRMTSLLSDQSLGQRLATQARLSVVEQFDIDRSAERLISLFAHDRSARSLDAPA